MKGEKTMRTQLFEDANASHSLFVNAIVNEGGEFKARTFTKVAIELVQRNGENQATQNVSFFLDMGDALAWFTMMSDTTWTMELTQFKEFSGKTRGIKISPTGGKGVRVSIQETNGTEKKLIYFDLSKVKALEMALVVSAFTKVFFNKKFSQLLAKEEIQ
jgi:hypothetical protein